MTHSAPITASSTTIASEPELITGETDSATNGPLGEYIHPAIVVQGLSGAGHWAVVELYFIKKPV